MREDIYRTLRRFWRGGQATRRHLQELRKTQWLAPEELERWQFSRLKKLVKFAYEHVPYYRDRYRNADIHPEDIKSFADFQALPFLTREDVNKNLDRMVAPHLRKKTVRERTGGSTGEPIRFFVDNSFWWWNAALEFRCREWYRVKEGDKLAWVWGDMREIKDKSWTERIKARLMGQKFLNAFAMTDDNMRSFAEMLSRWQPAIIRAYVSAIALLARHIKTLDIDPIRPKLIETSAEKLSDPQRELLEEVFRCPIADCYSSRELSTMAYECEKGRLHACETCIPEIIVKGQPANPGKMGEVVVTSLTQYAMPFIRYKNGDMGIAAIEQHCDCGRGLPVFQEIVGRTNDYLVTSEGQFVHNTYFLSVFNVRPEVIRFQVFQPDRNRLDIRLECNQSVSQEWLNALTDQVRYRFGQATQITIHVVDKIELTTSGKLRFVISEVEPDFI